MSAADARYMARALELARAQAGRTGVNPAVGCVIVQRGNIVAEGATADGGRPHAERMALNLAGPLARGADIYVTLEPCAHERPWGCCADALTRAKPGRVVIASLDPDPRTNGAGEAKLRAAGIAVETGLMEAEAKAINKDFFARNWGKG